MSFFLNLVKNIVMADYVNENFKIPLKEVYDANKLTKYDKFKEYDVESFEMFRFN